MSLIKDIEHALHALPGAIITLSCFDDTDSIWRGQPVSSIAVDFSHTASAKEFPTNHFEFCGPGLEKSIDEILSHFEKRIAVVVK